MESILKVGSNIQGDDIDMLVWFRRAETMQNAYKVEINVLHLIYEEKTEVNKS